MAKKDMVWKEEDGTRYKISFSEQLQRKNLQATRALIRNARKEIAQARPPRAQRALFRLLRETLEGR